MSRANHMANRLAPARGGVAVADTFSVGLIDLMPNLAAFARSLTRDICWADDLVQETMVKALTHRRRFAAGTNQRAWLFTILRNTFLSDIRRRKREHSVPAEAGHEPGDPAATDGPENAFFLGEIGEAMRTLPDVQRRALLLVAVFGHSYGAAAELERCAVGTMKSRVSRARQVLTDWQSGGR